MLSPLPGPVAQLTERRRARRAERFCRERLRAELASYRTPAERADLQAILARHTAEEIAELEAQLR